MRGGAKIGERHNAMSSREQILKKLRSTQAPFGDAPPRPKAYIPVTDQADGTPEALLERFVKELSTLMGEPFIVEGDAQAREKVIELLKSHNAAQILAWDFNYIPVKGLYEAIRAAGVQILYLETRDEFRAELLAEAEGVPVGLTGVDYAAATTGTLVFTSGRGKGRIPTALPPVHIAVITVDQILLNIEAWVAKMRETRLRNISDAANVCFVSGPSRTGDIEMELVLGVHGPGRVQVIIKK